MAKNRFNSSDHFFEKAKAEGFKARSVYKLKEIDEKLKLIKNNSRVLDLGCAPGSWLQYVDQKIGKKGSALGIDLSKVETQFENNIRCIEKDIYKINSNEIFEIMKDLSADFEGFDLVLSDMAPKTSGIKHVDQIRSLALAERVYELSLELLKSGGSMIIKVFDGGDVNNFMGELRKHFAKVKHMRPKSVRDISKEFYVVAINKK